MTNSADLRHRHFILPAATLLGSTLLMTAGCLSLDNVAGDDVDDIFVEKPEVVGLPGAQDRPVVHADIPPPALSGGTLDIAPDGITAVAADPDNDIISIVDLDRETLIAEVTLPRGDEPGRVTHGDGGRAHVALRRGGAVVTVNTETGELLRRQDVCATPRGMAYDDDRGLLHVACASGELVTLDEATGRQTRRLELGIDLRDVVVLGDRLMITQFRSADLMFVASDGSIVDRTAPDGDTGGSFRAFTPSVAWRAVPLPGGGAAVSHQWGQENEVQVSTPGGYGGGGGCRNSIVASGLTVVTPAGGEFNDIGRLRNFTYAELDSAVLPVDLAVSSDGRRMVVAAPGNFEVDLPQVFVRSTNELSSFPNVGGCLGDPDFLIGEDVEGAIDTEIEGQVTAVDFDGQDRIVVQTRNPASVVVLDNGEGHTVTLSGGSNEDTGHAIFHQNTGANLACASCHPEGGEDGRTWTFEGIGIRRTQSIRGGLMDTAPFHWDGDMRDFNHLVDEVFVHRMGGLQPSKKHSTAMSDWIDSVPSLTPARKADDPAVVRGEEVFHDATVACATCHDSENKFTTDLAFTVGTGGRFQVPSLMGVAYRTPLMHDGCAADLRSRFTRCGGGDDHGKTSHLSERQLLDLIAYLESL